MSPPAPRGKGVIPSRAPSGSPSAGPAGDPAGNRRRSRAGLWVSRLARRGAFGWDAYLFGLGYGSLLGLLGGAAWWLPDLAVDGAGAGVPLPAGHRPGPGHWFGLDPSGTDLMAPVLKGAGLSLWVAVIAVAGGTAGGALIGAALHYLMPGRPDGGARRPAGNPFATLPALIAALAGAAGFGAGFWTMTAVLGLVTAISLAGRVRTWFREGALSGDAVAARAMGWSRRQLMAEQWRSWLWKRAGASAAATLPPALLAESAVGMAFGGHRRIGYLLAEGLQGLFGAPWMWLFPGLVLSAVLILLAGLAWAVGRCVQEPPLERLW